MMLSPWTLLWVVKITIQSYHPHDTLAILRPALRYRAVGTYNIVKCSLSAQGQSVTAEASAPTAIADNIWTISEGQSHTVKH